MIAAAHIAIRISVAADNAGNAAHARPIISTARFSKMVFYCCYWIIIIISFLLVDGNSDRSKKISSYDELFDNGNSFTVNNGPYIVEKLLPHIPTGNYFEIDYFKWSAQYTFGNSVKRFAVEIIKKANESIIKKDPALFWHYYEPYMGKGYAVFDEIILAGLKSLPESESNRVIEYLSDDLDKRVFDKTSSANSSLSLAMETIEKHTKYCDEECVATLEKNIQKYISPKAIEWYKDRIGYNKWIPFFKSIVGICAFY